MSFLEGCPLGWNLGVGVEALLLAILDGHYALYKVRGRLEDRRMFPLLPPAAPPRRPWRSSQTPA